MELFALRPMAELGNGTVLRLGFQKGRHLFHHLDQCQTWFSQYAGDLIHLPLGILINSCLKQRLFGWKIAVTQSLCHLHGLGNLGHRGFFIALFPKKLQGRI